MSEQKLSLSHKIFAAVERLIKETRVKEADLNIPVTAKKMDVAIEGRIDAVEVDIPASVMEPRFTIDAETVEIVGDLTRAPVCDAAVETLSAAVVDENVDAINAPVVHDESLQLDSQPRDLFRQFNIKGDLYYETCVNDVNFERLKPRTLRLKLEKIAIKADVRENLALFKRLTVEQKPVILSFLSEKQQLAYWKQAVSQTGKEARQLEMTGIYTGVPYDSIEKIRFNYAKKSLSYNYKPGSAKFSFPGSGSRSELKDIALFTDLNTDKTVVVLRERVMEKENE